MDPEVYPHLRRRCVKSYFVSVLVRRPGLLFNGPTSFRLGLSAGAASCTLHMVANGGDSEGLFHAIWAESGALQHVGHIDDSTSQGVYDSLVSATNCTGAGDTLQCLREVPGDVFENLVDNSGVNFWLLTADGKFLQDLPQLELIHGHVAHNVSVVQGLPIWSSQLETMLTFTLIGISEDEGTIATLTFPDGGYVFFLLKEFLNLLKS